MLKYFAACLCITTAAPAMAMVDGLEETDLESIDVGDPNYGSLHYFVGDWRCIDNGEDGARDNNLTVFHVYGTLKHWYAMEAISFGAVKTESTTYLSYSPHKQAFVEFGLTAHGGWGRGFAPGWENNALTFTGYAHYLDHEGHHWRKTFKPIDDTHFTFTWATSTDGQIYTIKMQATCSK